MAEEERRTPRHLGAENSPAARQAAARGAARHEAPKRRSAAAERRRSARDAGGRGELFEKSLLPMVENVHRLDQTSLRVGVLWLVLLPVLLLVIRKLTGSSKLTFLIIWVVGMFIISAALILIGYADHQLKRFLEDVKRYEPAAADTTLDSLLGAEGSDPYALPVAPEALLGLLRRIRERHAAEDAEGAGEDEAQLLAVEQWLLRLEQRRGKEGAHAEHPTDHTR